jgi:L-threonylcarbamoyladenylate synthase
MKVLTDCTTAALIVELLNGKTVILPTETSYGLGCDATNQEAVDSIFAIKGRPSDKPLLVVVPTIEMAKKHLIWNDTLEKIANTYWPGPVTVVGEYNGAARPALASGVVAKDGTVAVRVTNDPFLVSLTEIMNRPLVATSGNVSDAGDMYDSKAVEAMFQGRAVQPDYILARGVLPNRPPTTIVRVRTDGTLTIIRQGEITISL